MEPEPVKTFLWWFTTGAVMTLAVLMVQGGVQDLISGRQEPRQFRAHHHRRWPARRVHRHHHEPDQM